MNNVFVVSFLLTLLVHFPSCSHNTLPCVYFTFEPVISQENTHLKISLTFQGNVSGTTIVQLPDQWLEEKDLWKQIRNIHTEGEDIQLYDTEVASKKILKHSPLHVCTLSYEVHQDWISGYRPHRPLITSELIHCIGYGFLALPDHLQGEETSIHAFFDWKNIPSSWKLATSFGTSHHQEYRGPCHSLKNALFSTGLITLHTFTIKGNAVVLSLHNKLCFSQKVQNCLHKIIEAQRDFFNDHAFPYYIVSCITLPDDLPLEEAQNTLMLGGRALTNGFACFLSPLSMVSERLATLFAHEHFHTWNGIQSRALFDYELGWLMEGFTEYYGYVFAIRCGLLTVQEMLTILNEDITHYYLSPFMHSSNSSISHNFYNKDYTIRKIIYTRGLVVAFLLNKYIKETTHNCCSLDTLVQELFSYCISSKTKITLELFIHFLQKYLINGIPSHILHFITHGGPIPAAIELFSPLAICIYEDKASFELGFDFEQSKQQKMVMGVQEESNAYQAGLRNGQRLQGWSIYSGDTSKEVEITIEDKTIKYFPLSKRRVTVPQYVLAYSFYDTAAQKRDNQKQEHI